MNHFEHYLEVREIAGLATSTLETEKECHERLWSYLNGPENILEITRQNVLDYAEHLATSDLKPNTRRKLLGNLRAFYDYAVKENWIYQSPLNRIQLPSKREDPPRVLSVYQMKCLLEIPDINTVIGLRDRTIMELMYSSALRRSELVELKTSSFLDDYRCVKVMGKGTKESILPVGKLAAHFLKFYIEHVLPEPIKQNDNNVFISFNRQEPLKSKYVYQMVRDYGRKAQFKFDISPHVFRYSIATHLADNGVDVKFIQDFLRHESPRTTTRYIEQGFKQLQSVHERTHPRAK